MPAPTGKNFRFEIGERENQREPKGHDAPPIPGMVLGLE